MAFKSIEQICQVSKDNQINFFRAVIEDDMEERGVSFKDSMTQMSSMWKAMLDASQNYDGELKSKSGLVGGNGLKMKNYEEKKEGGYCGPFISEVIAEALKMGESNACMKRIVAAPTAGSCGVIPAVLIASQKYHAIPDEKIIEALFVAAGIGQVIAERAFIAGASGGCQAEVGAAAAMAGGALAYLKGGDNNQISHAVAISLKNLLGLVCDPVAGLVEVPCVKRNVIGALDALAAADMALAGVESQVPADQVIDAMKEIGENMDVKYKETACGGCGITPRGVEIEKSMMGNELSSDH